VKVTGPLASVQGSKLASFTPGSGGSLSGLIAALANVDEMSLGEFTGTGSLLTVTLPFVPLFVFVFDLTAGSTWGFAANTPSTGTKSYKQVTTAGMAAVASQGILFTANVAQFQVGTDANLNVNTHVYQYIAIGN
jgi:hypothetical protein